MTRSLFPLLFILAGIATIVFRRTIASNTIEAYRKFHIPLLIPEESLPYSSIALGVFMIIVGMLFLFEFLRP